MTRNGVNRALLGALALLAALAMPGALAQERVLVEAEAVGIENPYKQLFFVESGVIPEGRNEGTVIEANANFLFVRMGPREQDLLRLNAVGEEPVRFQDNDRLILTRHTGSSTTAGRTTPAGTSPGTASTTTSSSGMASSSSAGSAVSGTASSSYGTTGSNRASAASPSQPGQPSSTATASSSYRSTTDASSPRADRLPATASWLPLLVIAGVAFLMLGGVILAWRRLS